MPLNFSQKHIKRKLRKYLQIYLPHSDLIAKLTQGYCGGFTALYLYALWLQFEHDDKEHPVQRDDLDWLLKTFKRVTEWDEHRALSKAERSEFERLINLLEYYQNGIDGCTNDFPGCHFSKLFFDTQGRTAVREYTIAAHFTRVEAAKILSKIARDDKLVFVHSHNHLVGLLKRGADYYFIDPNMQKSVLIIQQIELVAAYIFDANDFNRSKPSPLGFEVIGFADDENRLESYPPQQELLKDLKIFQPGYEFLRYLNEWKDEEGRNALHQAASLGSVESVDYILQHLHCFPAGYIDRAMNNEGTTPLMLACIAGHDAIADQLIKAGANIHLHDKNDGAALTYALVSSENNPNSKLPDLLIAAGANVNDIYKKKLTPLLFAVIRNLPITLLNKLCAAGADPTFSLYLYAAYQDEGDAVNISKTLQQLGADKQQALRIAIEKDDDKAVAWLIKLDVNINKLDSKDNMTPLMLAVKRKNMHVLLELLRSECDLKTPESNTALMLADDFISFDILTNLGGRPADGWQNWVISARESGLDVRVWLTTLLRSYIQHKQSSGHSVSQYFHKIFGEGIFGESREVSQARHLLQAVVSKTGDELDITVDELRDLYQIYQKQTSIDLKKDNRVNL